tara:strand:- start:8741 stop:9337 length:597 start_codon:yes stop_codon:yes gene_type:complete
MIKFLNNSLEEPFIKLQSKYNKASNANQSSIEAISISSFNKDSNEVNSRLVNLKFIDEDKFIFFSNYNSPKSDEFDTHNQISAIIFWQSINTQIRMKAKIKKTSKDFNERYFEQRSPEKNALAISSTQSKIIESFEQVIEKYNDVKVNYDLQECPEYWGGFMFIPYEIEFWEGGKHRLNKRNLYKHFDNKWHHYILEP